MSVRSRFSDRVSVVVDCSSEPSMAKQSMKDECDINNIVARYQRTGQITHLNAAAPRFGFFPALDFREAVEMVRVARDSFMALPSKARKFFENDPEKFLAYIESTPDLKVLRELGLGREVVAAIAEKLEEATGPAGEGESGPAKPEPV